MIPFPGESLGVYSYENRVGDPIDSLSQISSRAGAAFFGPGASAKVVVFLGSEYLETDADPGEVSWCVEIAGGTGSLTLTECLGNGEPDVLLGTFAVTPGVPLVVPSSVLTLANVFNDTWASLLVECTGAAVMVQQVKLRAFPTGGPLGGWGDTLHPAWERTGFAGFTAASRTPDAALTSWSSPGPTNYAMGWENTLAQMPAVVEGDADEVPVPVDVGSGLPSVQGQSYVRLAGQSTTAPPPGSSSGGAEVDSDGAILTRDPGSPDVNPAEGLVEGVDYIANPYEVPGDASSYANADTMPVAEWDPLPTITTEQFIDNDPPTVAPLLGALPWEPSVDGTGAAINLWPDHAAVPPEDLTLPDVDAVVLGPSHGWFRGTAPTVPDTIVSDDVWVGEYRNGFTWAATAPVTYTVAMPAYRVWEITTTTEEPLRIMRRGDNLGMGSSRIYSTGTRQRSTRVYGVL